MEPSPLLPKKKIIYHRTSMYAEGSEGLATLGIYTSFLVDWKSEGGR